MSNKAQKQMAIVPTIENKAEKTQSEIEAEKLASLVNERIKGLQTLCKQTESVLQSTHKLASENISPIICLMRHHGKGDDFISSTLKNAMEFLNSVKLESVNLQVIDKLGKRRQVKLDLKDLKTPEAMAFKCVLAMQDAFIKAFNVLN
jgi:hypothetical protein